MRKYGYLIDFCVFRSPNHLPCQALALELVVQTRLFVPFLALISAPTLAQRG